MSRIVLGPSRWAFRVAGLALYGVLGTVAGLLLAIAVPAMFGWSSFAVLSGSMAPTIETGALVIDQPILPTQARVGDVVTFKSPNDDGKLLTHRVRRVERQGEMVNVISKGDANNMLEHWSVPARGKIGRVVYQLPKVGYLAVAARSRGGVVFLLFVPALLLALLELRQIWRPTPSPAGRPEIELVPAGLVAAPTLSRRLVLVSPIAASSKVDPETEQLINQAVCALADWRASRTDHRSRASA